jgi:hypothetical protein
MELKDIITDIYRVVNQVSDSKRNLVRAASWGTDGVHTKQQQIDLLKKELADTDYDLDKIKDALYELTEALENEVYNQEMAALSPFNKEK